MPLSAKRPSSDKHPAMESMLKEVEKPERKHRINVDLDEKVFMAVKIKAMQNRTNVSEVIRKYLNEYINE